MIYFFLYLLIGLVVAVLTKKYTYLEDEDVVLFTFILWPTSLLLTIIAVICGAILSLIAYLARLLP